MTGYHPTEIIKVGYQSHHKIPRRLIILLEGRRDDLIMKTTPICRAAGHERSYFVLGLTWLTKPKCFALNPDQGAVPHVSHEVADPRTSGILAANTEVR